MSWLRSELQREQAVGQDGPRPAHRRPATQDKNGAVTYFLANPTADKMTDNATRMFLGVQLQCAQCHNHPFTELEADRILGHGRLLHEGPCRRQPAAGRHEAAAPSADQRERPRAGRRRLPESAKIVPAKFLGRRGAQARRRRAVPPGAGQLDDLAPTNPYFARAMVNRIWAQLFGRGLVNPVDDMHDDNPPSHPELLADLTEQFAASGFDLKHLIRGHLQQRGLPAHQQAAGRQRRRRPELFSHMAVKPLTPEQLFDSLAAGRSAPPGERGPQAPRRDGQRRRRITPRDAFVTFFRVDDDADPPEYQAGIPQALRLMNSPQLNNAAHARRRCSRPARPPAEVVEQLYLADAVAPADAPSEIARMSPTSASTATQAAQGLRRHPLGAAELQRVRAEPLTIDCKPDLPCGLHEHAGETSRPTMRNITMTIANFLDGLSRRDLLKLSAAGVPGASLSGWLQRAGEPRGRGQRAKHKSCILLWMDGGPSHKDTFDLKPGTPGRRRVQADQHRACPASRSASTSRSFARLMQPRRHPPRHEHRRGRPRPGQVLPAHRLPGRRRRPRLPQPRLHRLHGARPARHPAAELRLRRQPQLRLRLPRRRAISR